MSATSSAVAWRDLAGAREESIARARGPPSQVTDLGQEGPKEGMIGNEGRHLCWMGCPSSKAKPDPSLPTFGETPRRL